APDDRRPRPRLAGVSLGRCRARPADGVSRLETGLSTRLYAGLRSGAVDRLTDFAWPTPAVEAPGSWVEAGVDAPDDAVRGFSVEQLPWWLDDELWQLELGGEHTAELRRTRATRGRLIRRVETWTPEVATS